MYNTAEPTETTNTPRVQQYNGRSEYAATMEPIQFVRRAE